jgi:hypothetical protein
MKTAVAMLIMLISASFISKANACQTQEAQFIGAVANITTQADDQCLVKMTSFKFYSSSGICPLLIEETYNEGITLDQAQCQSLQANDEISGIVYRDNSGVIRWE